MSLQDVVNVTITAGARQVSQRGFGTPLCLAYHNKFLDRVRTYSDTTDMVADGFTSADPAYKLVNAVFSQSPRPPEVKLGRRTTAYTHTFDLIPTVTTQGFVYAFTVDGVEITYTVLAAATVATIATALAALVDALSSVTATGVSGTHVAVTAATAGTLINVSERVKELRYLDTTTDSGVSADLDACLIADGDFYGVCLDALSKAQLQPAAAWAESKTCLLVINSADWNIKDAAVTTDTFSTLKGLGYARTVMFFNEANTASFAGAAILGDRLPAQPGSDTWEFKGFSGVAADALTETEINAIEGKNGNYYVVIANVSVLQGGGVVAEGEYADVVRGTDWLKARIQERVFSLFVNNEKIAYTDLGVDQIKTEVGAQLQQGVDVKFLASDPAYNVTAPKVRDVAANVKASRRLPDVRFSATLAGAIHATDINGLLQV